MLCFKLHVSVALTWNVTVAKTTQGCVVENQQAVPHQHIFFLVFFTLYKTAEADASCKMSTLSQRFAWLDFDIGKLFFNIITRLEVQQTIAHTSTCTLASCGDCIMRLWAQVLCGMPVYFLQLIDHMKSSELDFGSQWAREWYRLCECASMCVSAL